MRTAIGLVLALLLATACTKHDERAQRERDEQAMMARLLTAAAEREAMDAAPAPPPPTATGH